MANKYFGDKSPKKVPRHMSSRSPGRRKSPQKNETSFKKGNRAIYTKVPSVSESSLPKKSYTQLYSLKRPPVDPKEITTLGDAFVTWSTDDDSFILEEFAIQQGIAPSHFKRLINKHTYFAECYEFAKAVIAARRERIVGRDLFKAMHPMYNDEWGAYLDARKEKENESSTQSIIVVTQPAKETDVVPKRKQLTSSEC